MTRPYASHVDFRFYSGQSSKVDCYTLLQEMSMVGSMSHVAVVEHVALNLRSMSMKISFTRDKSLPVPYDRISIPDSFDLTLRCMNPEISGHVNCMHCSQEIDSISIDGSTGRLSLNTYYGAPLASIEIKYSSIAISANIPEVVNSVVKETEYQ